ncbi:hypothetical protein M2360_004590 [Rhizobium sp. SG_E_25_P2]|nr:hypothetical protein [Rhizobium sp. SG_E_25_P2]
MPVFYLQRLDPATGSALAEARFEIEDTARLAAALGMEGDDGLSHLRPPPSGLPTISPSRGEIG